MIGLLTLAVIAVAVAFAVSIGAHYTGACMGMSYAAGAIRLGPALLLMAPLAFLGAALASEGVEATVGHGLLGAGPVSLTLALVILVVALALTSAYNFLTLPTSTIQILVFATVGAGIAAGRSVEWDTVAELLALWAVAPVIAFGLGYGLTALWDRVRERSSSDAKLGVRLAAGLVGVGAVASFAMGANDVANASGALVMTGTFDLLLAALAGGAGLALGVITWGRPLLEKVALKVVRLDGRMAVSAQAAQASVILGSVLFGFFTSMNQALVGAMIGCGIARGRDTLARAAVRDILLGWALGPVSGATLGFALADAAVHLGWL